MWSFLKRSKEEEYDEEYFLDEELEDEEDEYDEYEEEDEEAEEFDEPPVLSKRQLKKTSTKEKKVPEEAVSKLQQVEIELEQVERENLKLITELAMVEAIPKDYEAKIFELTTLKNRYKQLKEDYQVQKESLALYRRKIERYVLKVRQYEEELALKQEEISQFNTTNHYSSINQLDEQFYTEELAQVKRELAEAHSQLRKLNEKEEPGLSKEDIGEVLLDAKKQAKKIIQEAQTKATVITDEMNSKVILLRQLEKVEKNYREYYGQIQHTKDEFSQIMHSHRA